VNHSETGIPPAFKYVSTHPRKRTLTKLRLSRTIFLCSTVWDPAKDVLNQSKHGLSLAEGIPALEDPERDSWINDHFNYDEIRMVTAGRSGSKVLFVVSTELDRTEDGKEIARIISVRKAKWHEENWSSFRRT